jgi:predicted RNase H-like nuclease
LTGGQAWMGVEGEQEFWIVITIIQGSEPERPHQVPAPTVLSRSQAREGLQKLRS